MNEANLSQIHHTVFTVGRITPNGLKLLGTCFLLKEPGFLATAAHVTSNDDRNLVIIFNPTGDIFSYQDTSDHIVKSLEAKIYAVDTVRDICILKIESPACSSITISGSDNTGIGKELDILGYPHCTDGRRVLTFQTTVVGAKVLIPSSGIKSKHLILNIQARPGQSGSPVFDSLTGSLVAITIGSYAREGGSVSVSGINPKTLHQTTHAISAEYLNDMI